MSSLSLGTLNVNSKFNNENIILNMTHHLQFSYSILILTKINTNMKKYYIIYYYILFIHNLIVIKAKSLQKIENGTKSM